MKLGCFGCLTVIVAGLIVVVVTLGIIFLSTNIFSPPDVRQVAFTRGDGYAAQQKLYEIVLRQSGQSSRRDPIAISEAEANAFLSRHLEQSGLPLSPIIVRFTRGQLVIQGRTALRNLIKGPPFAQILPYVSDRRLEEPVWVTVRGNIRVEGTGNSRQGTLDVAEFALGKQPLGSSLLWLLLGPSGGGVLTWHVPASVDDVRIGDGQLHVATR